MKTLLTTVALVAMTATAAFAHDEETLTYDVDNGNHIIEHYCADGSKISYLLNEHGEILLGEYGVCLGGSSFDAEDYEDLSRYKELFLSAVAAINEHNPEDAKVFEDTPPELVHALYAYINELEANGDYDAALEAVAKVLDQERSHDANRFRNEGPEFFHALYAHIKRVEAKSAVSEEIAKVLDQERSHDANRFRNEGPEFFHALYSHLKNVEARKAALAAYVDALEEKLATTQEQLEFLKSGGVWNPSNW